MTETHECVGCRRDLPLTDFAPRKARGPGHYYTRCRECVRERERTRPVATATQWPQLTDKAWLAEAIQRMNGTQIADELGCTRSTVHRALRAHGLRAQGRSENVTVAPHLGERHGLLVIVEPAGKTYYGHRVRCRCDCGGEAVKYLNKILRKDTHLDCGCRTADRIRKGNARQNSKRPTTGDGYTYSSYQAMRQRCERPKCNGYENYGGRGIVVCERWRGKAGWPTFYADMGPRPDGHSLDRIDPEGNYEPTNCRWATPMEQGANRRDRLRRRRELEARVAVLEAQLRALGVEPVMERSAADTAHGTLRR